MVNRKEERNTVEVSTMDRPVNFLERAYRQAETADHDKVRIPYETGIFFNLRPEKLDLWIPQL